jgi:hypothetical protein
MRTLIDVSMLVVAPVGFAVGLTVSMGKSFLKEMVR